MRYAAFATLATLFSLGNAFESTIQSLDLYGNVIRSETVSTKEGDEVKFQLWLGTSKKHLAAI